MFSHTHTHTCSFLWKVGTSHRRNGFYTYKRMCLLPYTYPIPNLALTGDCAFQLSQKPSLCMIYKRLFEKWDMGQCPEKSPSPCNTCVHTVSLYKSMSWFVTKTRAPHTHTHTTHTNNTHCLALTDQMQMRLVSSSVISKAWACCIFHTLFISKIQAILHQGAKRKPDLSKNRARESSGAVTQRRETHSNKCNNTTKR